MCQWALEASTAPSAAPTYLLLLAAAVVPAADAERRLHEDGCLDVQRLACVVDADADAGRVVAHLARLGRREGQLGDVKGREVDGLGGGHDGGWGEVEVRGDWRRGSRLPRVFTFPLYIVLENSFVFKLFISAVSLLLETFKQHFPTTQRVAAPDA